MAKFTGQPTLHHITWQANTVEVIPLDITSRQASVDNLTKHAERHVGRSLQENNNGVCPVYHCNNIIVADRPPQSHLTSFLLFEAVGESLRFVGHTQSELLPPQECRPDPDTHARIFDTATGLTLQNGLHEESHCILYKGDLCITIAKK